MGNFSNSNCFIKNLNFNRSICLKNRCQILAAIIVSAILLRFYKLYEDLWYDEILTNVRYAAGPYGKIISTFDSQNQNFLFPILARTSDLVIGESRWSLRLSEVDFRSGTIWATCLVRRQVSNTNEALLSAAMLYLARVAVTTMAISDFTISGNSATYNDDFLSGNRVDYGQAKKVG